MRNTNSNEHIIFRVLGRGLAQFHSVNLGEVKPVGCHGENHSQTGEVIFFNRFYRQIEAFSDKLSDAQLQQRFVVRSCYCTQ